MKNWKIIIRYNGNEVEIRIKARSYSDAYIKTEQAYPGCIIKNIDEIRTII